MNSTVKTLNSRAKKAICMACVCVVMLLVSSSVAWGQWGATPGTQNISNTNTGNVGIGTPAPGKLLTVNGDAAVTTLYGNSTSQSANDSLKLGPGSNGNFFIDNIGAGGLAQTILGYNTTKTSGANYVFSIFNNSTDRNLLFYAQSAGTSSSSNPNAPNQSFNQVNFPNGVVGIGTQNPLFKLHVGVTSPGSDGFHVSAADGRFAHISPGVGPGYFNPISQAGDTAIIFGNGTTTPGPASLVIAPWSGALSGLRMDSNGNVGIGTSNPAAKLHVEATDGNHFLYTVGAAQPWNGGAYSDNTFRINQAGIASRFVINNSGNVGIGTPGPNYRLDVQGGSINASGGLCIAGDCRSSWSQLAGGSSQWTAASGNLSYTAGNVVIGTVSPTASPAYTLDVNGGFFHTTVNSQVFPTSSGAGGLAVGWNRSNGFAEVNFYNVYNKAPIAFQFSQKTGLDPNTHNDTAADLLTIMGNGRVGIGTPAPSEALEVVGSIKVSGNINAKYQDVAEWVPSSQQLVAGTVVVLDSQSSNHVIASTREYDTAVAGVISEKPGISLGESGEGRLLVATTGRVMVQVDASHGPIRVGDLLVTSGNTGMAMRSEPLDLGGTRLHRPGTLIGKALEPLNSGTGKILVLLSLQ